MTSYLLLCLSLYLAILALVGLCRALHWLCDLGFFEARIDYRRVVRIMRGQL